LAVRLGGDPVFKQAAQVAHVRIRGSHNQRRDRLSWFELSELWPACSGTAAAPPPLGDGDRYAALCDAPGTYVFQK